MPIADIDLKITDNSGLRAGTGNETANSCAAVAVIIGPHHGRAETVGLSYNSIIRHDEPLSIESYTIVSILRVSIDILHTDTIGKSAAQSVFAL